MRKNTYRKIWVRCAPHPDEALIGKEICRMPWNNKRYFTCEPMEVEETPDVIRMINLGDLIVVKAPETEE